jgi:hypothetical protein
MKLETVGRVSVGDMGFEIGRQIDNVDGSEGAFLWTNTTSNTKVLGYEGDFRCGLDFDTEPSTSHNRAGFLN